jgi:internalin A
MKILPALCMLLISNAILAQGFNPYTALEDYRHYSYEEALKVHPDSVFVLVFTETQTIPAGIKKFKHLKSLQIEACVEMDLEKELKKIRGNQELIHLSIGGYYGKEFPEIVLQFTSLKALELKGMEFSVVPDGIGNLRKLEFLAFGDPAFGGCELRSLPPTLKNLSGLKTLVLCGNMEYVPGDEFYQLTQLEEIDLTWVQFFDFARFCKSFPNLVRLNISGCQIESLQGIEQLGRLEELTVGMYEGLASFGDRFHELSSLRFLRVILMDSTLNKEIFRSISMLPNLNTLYLHYLNGCPGDFPFAGSGFPQLRNFHIEGNGTNKLSETIEVLIWLPKLEELGLAVFSGAELPQELFGMRSLKVLSLYSLDIRELPEDISKLSLVSLKIGNTKLATLPYSMLDMPSLRHLRLWKTNILHDNPVITQLQSKGVEIEWGRDK